MQKQMISRGVRSIRSLVEIHNRHSSTQLISSLERLNTH